MERPIGVTILTFVAVLLAFLNGIAMLRFLGFLPVITSYSIHYTKLYEPILIPIAGIGVFAYIMAIRMAPLVKAAPDSRLDRIPQSYNFV